LVFLVYCFINLQAEKKKKEEKIVAAKPEYFEIDLLWICQKCDSVFDSYEAVCQHQDDTKHAKAACYCGVKNLGNRELEEHKKTSRHYKCEVCGACFESYSSVVAHMRSQSHFYCYYCSKQFDKEEKLYNHKRSLMGRQYGHDKEPRQNIFIEVDDSDSEEEYVPKKVVIYL
jgi:hypothetical protein